MPRPLALPLPLAQSCLTSRADEDPSAVLPLPPSLSLSVEDAVVPSRSQSRSRTVREDTRLWRDEAVGGGGVSSSGTGREDEVARRGVEEEGSDSGAGRDMATRRRGDEAAGWRGGKTTRRRGEKRECVWDVWV